MFPIKKDVYVEYGVSRGLRPMEIVYRVMIILMIVVLIAIDLLVAPMLQNFAIIAYAITAGGIVLGWKYFKKVGAEYEYIFTNGQLDIDKIIGKEDRRRLYTIDVKELEVFEPYDGKKMENRKFDRRGFPCSSHESPDLYCLVFRHREYGRTMLCINMNDELKEAIQGFLPRTFGALPAGS